jgi:hypothetical protein
MLRCLLHQMLHRQRDDFDEYEPCSRTGAFVRFCRRQGNRKNAKNSKQINKIIFTTRNEDAAGFSRRARPCSCCGRS